MNGMLCSNDFDLVLVRLLTLVICFEGLLALTTVSYFTYRVASVFPTAHCVKLIA
jgi:phage shock protein PspC (stress-responsive transcriptional regulator)